MAQLVYNPTLIDKEELRQMLVGREALLKDLLKKIKESSGKKTFTNYILIGQRGIGKTHLLLLLYYSIKEDPDLSQKWIPVRFNEEEYSISNISDFLFRIVEEISKETGDSEVETIFNEVSSMSADALTDRSLSYLHKLRDSGRQILLLIDNFDRILDQLGEIDTARLRDVLMTEGTILLIGAASSIFDQIINHEKPFYDFFEITMLEELNPDQVETLIRKRAELDSRQDLLDQFDDLRPRVLATTHLTGGIPRLILMVYRIFADSGLIEAKEAFEELLDELTPFYQDRMNRLAPQQRKLLDTMALMDGPTSPTPLARESRIGIRQVTTQLGRLREEGYVRQIQIPSRKRTRWEITERLFRIWRELRMTPSAKRVPFLLQFLKIWLTPRILKREISRLLDRLAQPTVTDDPKQLSKLSEYCSYLQLVAEPDQRVALYVTHMKTLVQKKPKSLSINSLKEFENQMTVIAEELPEPTRSKFLAHGYSLIIGLSLENACSELQWKAATEIIANSASDSEQKYLAYSIRGAIKFEESDYSTAMMEFSAAIESNSNNAVSYFNLGQAFRQLGRYDDAMNAFTRAIQISPEYLDGWLLLGDCYATIGNLKDARNAFQRAVKLQPDNPNANLSLAAAIAKEEGLTKNYIDQIKTLFYEAMKSNIHDKHKEVQNSMLENISTGIAGNFMFRFTQGKLIKHLARGSFVMDLASEVSEDNRIFLLQAVIVSLLGEKDYVKVKEILDLIKAHEWSWENDKHILFPLDLATKILETGSTDQLSDLYEESRNSVELVLKEVQRAKTEPI